MADFCEECNRELFDMESDFKGHISEKQYKSGHRLLVLCEGCGPIYVNHNGVRIGGKSVMSIDAFLNYGDDSNG